MFVNKKELKKTFWQIGIICFIAFIIVLTLSFVIAAPFDINYLEIK